ncbi:hypothetical protein CLOSTASPAR_02038 [[Clostridium] asparagiforme DSM 15981]|uniref:Uncharacterized protein n=1 Tax=[Clostridium] asparagiforme DSM 15981 TaxID=518636 RepID=C0CYG2_9FIRM|nr:hypothetical protein CLOSTASPAR_02038 [[Clostridium] asparagiforme DSM 15981]
MTGRFPDFPVSGLRRNRKTRPCKAGDNARRKPTCGRRNR